jgi:PhnB protein
VARVSTYLNFMGDTEAAFERYRSVFGTDYSVPPMRMRDVPADPNGPQLSDAEQDLIMHVELPILAGHVLMGTDLIGSMGHELRLGNNVTINLEPDTREECDKLYGALSEGGTDASGMQDMFWGYWGTCCDRFGVRWMFNCGEQVA